MNKTKTINLQRTLSRMSIRSSVVMVAVLVIALFGIQSAYAAINTQLDFGDRGSEVTKLQTYLSSDANIYPEALVTGYFGPLTKAAIERFQTREGIISHGTPLTTGYGRVGPITRAAINAKLAGGTGGATHGGSGDISAPLIRSVNVDTDNNGASITWSTSEASFGKVYYSTSPIRISNTFDATSVFSGEPVVSGTLAQFDGLARVTHTVNIDNLTPNTTYFYLIVVFDSSKNVSISTPASFHIN